MSLKMLFHMNKWKIIFKLSFNDLDKEIKFQNSIDKM